MKSDLDRLMAERDLDALVTLPTEHDDPYRAYLTGGAHFSGMVVKKRGTPPVLIANVMEVDEAAKSGLKVYNNNDFGQSEIMRQHGADLETAIAEWYRRIFTGLDISGRVAVFGVGDINNALHLVATLSEKLADRVEFVTLKPRDNLFNAAYETKDAAEVERLRDVARKTSAVMRATRAWLAGHRANADEIVIQPDGAPLTIGDVKRHVRGLLHEHGLQDVEGMIFAQGRDAAVPHSRGEADQPLRLGQSIVFDRFPRAESGYFHDVTRTWCLGYAPPEVQEIFDTVQEAFERSMEMCKVGLSTRAPQVMVCEFFESKGHPSVLNSPGTDEGYIHSLAHGVGLLVHEAPYFPTTADLYTLKAGNVFTIEPGLYYHSKGYGVRIEDTVYLNDKGEMESLTDVPYDLVIDLDR